MPSKSSSTKAQALYDLTTLIQPVRRAWIQAAEHTIGVQKTSTSLNLVTLMVHRLGPDVQQKTLAKELGINAAAIVHLLDQGEQAGYVSRSELPGDRRSKAINLLPKGRKLAKEIELSLEQLREDLLGDVSSEDIMTTIKILRLLEERSLAYLQENKG